MHGVRIQDSSAVARREAELETERVKRSQLERDRELIAAALAERAALQSFAATVRGWTRSVAARRYAAATIFSLCTIIGVAGSLGFNAPASQANGIAAATMVGPQAAERVAAQPGAGDEATEMLSLKLAVTLDGASPVDR